MLICAITHKQSPGNGWPVWRNVWYFESELPITPGQAKLWAGEILWVEKMLAHESVEWGPVTFHTCTGDIGDQPVAAGVGGAQFGGMAARGFTNLLPYSIGLRIRGAKGVGRPANWVLRASLGEGDVTRGERNRIALVRPADLQAFLQYSISLTLRNVWDHLVEIRGAAIWPILAYEHVDALVVAGPIRLNAARRAMAKQLQNSNSIYLQVYGMVSLYLEKWEQVHNLWGDAPDFHYYPASLGGDVQDLIAVGLGLAEVLKPYLDDCDPDTDGDQIPQGRYLLTRDALKSIITKLKVRAESNQQSAGAVPVGVGPDGALYYDGPQWIELFGYATDLMGAICSCLAFDYLNSTLSGPQSSVRGGYLLDPEQGPSDG